MLKAWSLHGVALQSYHECTLSQVGARPDMTFDVVNMQRNTQKKTVPDLFLLILSARQDNNKYQFRKSLV